LDSLGVTLPTTNKAQWFLTSRSGTRRGILTMI
jgi:hypothetical protein